MTDTPHDSVLGYQIEHLNKNVADMQDVLKEIAGAMTRFAIVEERQAKTALAMERAFTALEKIELRLVAQESATVNVNNALGVQMLSIRAAQTEFDKHVDDYKKSEAQQKSLIDKGLGAWKILAWVLAGAQAVLVWAVLDFRSDLASIHADIVSLKLVDVRVIERLNSEAKIK